MISSPDTEKIAEYALKVADKSIEEQYTEVQSIRLRASFLITVNSLTATLFVRLVDIQSQNWLLFGLVVLAFCGCNLLSVLVMMPTADWRITKSGRAIVRDYIEGERELTATEAFAILAIKAEEDILRNEAVVRRAHGLFFFAVAFFAASTIFWVIMMVLWPNFSE